MTHMTRFTGRLRAAAGLAVPAVFALGLMSPQRASPPLTATIDIDAGTVENRISPLLYGQFIEFMYEGIKGGLHAELIRNRGLDSEPKTGLPAHWERYPDDRIDDYGITFKSERRATGARMEQFEGTVDATALRVELRRAVVARHGLVQSRVPIRQGV